jgi:N-acetylneuraminic acid mutarotase
MIIWGGESGGTTGGIYDPALDIWSAINTTNAPSQRYGFSWVWTGEGANSYNKKIMVWGGYSGSAPLGNGATYDPETNTWTELPTANAPSARMYHAGIWTGDKMFIWGGDGTSQTGNVYDPVYNSWGPMTTISAPTARLYLSGTWTGEEMVIWGGYNGVKFFNTGGRYKIETIAP